MDLGADDYLTKPFEEDELLSAIESRLAKSEILSKAMLDSSKKKISEPEDSLRNLNELKNFFDDNGVLTRFTKGDAIYKEGEHSNKIYLILEGVVKSHKMDENGKRTHNGIA